MSPNDSNPPLPPNAHEQIDQVCDRFEAVWRSGDTPRVGEFAQTTLADGDRSWQRELLVELIMLDLEYRWRTSASKPRLEEYASDWCTLGPSEPWPEDLIAHEYRVRHLWGDRPMHDEYLRRFGEHGPATEQVLAAIDEELQEAAGSPAPEPLPRMLGRLELLEVLGRGGMGVVYKARHTLLGRLVAVKLLAEHCVQDQQAVDRFLQEIKAIGELHHQNVVQAMDADKADGVYYLAMEYLDGIDLQALIEIQDLPVGMALALVRQAANGLQHIHEFGRVHRDLKPSNLMCTTEGTVKVLDLGLAALRENPTGKRLTEAGQMMGTLDYVAPEQLGDSRAATIQADIYSLGCTLYALLAGQPPFAGPNYPRIADKMAAHVRDAPPPLRSVCTEIPAGLVGVIDRMLAKAPANRYATPAEVAAALTPFADEMCLAEWWSPGGAAAFPPSKIASRPSRGGPLFSRRSWWVAAGVLLAAAALIFGIWTATHRQAEPEIADKATVPAPASPVPPATPAPLPAAPPLKLDVLVGSDNRQRELQDAVPLVSGERVRVSCQLPEGFQGSLFWFWFDGRAQLRCLASSERPGEKLDFCDDKIGKVAGPPGTEVIFVCARRGPAPSTEEIVPLLAMQEPIPAPDPNEEFAAFDQKSVAFHGTSGPSTPGFRPRIEELKRALARSFEAVGGVAFAHVEQ